MAGESNSGAKLRPSKMKSSGGKADEKQVKEQAKMNNLRLSAYLVLGLLGSIFFYQVVSWVYQYLTIGLVRLDVNNLESLNEAIYGGEPHMLCCNPADVRNIHPTLHQAKRYLKGVVTLRGIDCSSKLTGGKTVFQVARMPQHSMCMLAQNGDQYTDVPSEVIDGGIHTLTKFLDERIELEYTVASDPYSFRVKCYGAPGRRCIVVTSPPNSAKKEDVVPHAYTRIPAGLTRVAKLVIQQLKLLRRRPLRTIIVDPHKFAVDYDEAHETRRPKHSARRRTEISCVVNISKDEMDISDYQLMATFFEGSTDDSKEISKFVEKCANANSGDPGFYSIKPFTIRKVVTLEPYKVPKKFDPVDEDQKLLNVEHKLKELIGEKADILLNLAKTGDEASKKAIEEQLLALTNEKKETEPEVLEL